MLDTSPNQEALFHAQAAYRSRISKLTPKTRRYRIEEIVAHTVKRQDPARQEVESFIAAVFAQSYGANITNFMPELVALRDQDGVLMAAFGLRNAAQEPLFLEQYFAKPIESLLKEKLGLTLLRADISCIGNLAVANPRNAGVLIAHVIQHSLAIDIKWAVATAHHSLQNGLVKGGRDVYPLCTAHKTALAPQEQAHWGTYYQQLPQVVAIRGTANTPVIEG